MSSRPSWAKQYGCSLYFSINSSIIGSMGTIPPTSVSSFLNQPTFSIKADNRYAITSETINVLKGNAHKALKDEGLSHLSQSFNMLLLSMKSFPCSNSNGITSTSPPEHLHPSIEFRAMKFF